MPGEFEKHAGTSITGVGVRNRPKGFRGCGFDCNGGAIVPVFNDPHDEIALSLLQARMPDRKVVDVYAREILLSGSNVNSITQQQPAV